MLWNALVIYTRLKKTLSDEKHERWTRRHNETLGRWQGQVCYRVSLHGSKNRGKSSRFPEHPSGHIVNDLCFLPDFFSIGYICI